MSKDHIRYDLLVQNALKSVVRKVLVDASRDGLPPDHHFYVSFRTNVAGTKISNRLREKYPEEMTIVLQHQYWDLTVGEHQFEVGLSFAGIPERLVVPFDTITGFYDPSVEFGLKFEVKDEDVAASGPKPVTSINDAGPADSAAASPAPRPFTPRSLRERSAAASAAQDGDDPIARIGDAAKSAKVQEAPSEATSDATSAEPADSAAKDDTTQTNAASDDDAGKDDAAGADKAAAGDSKDKAAAEAGQESAGAQVVSLDAFRKKH